MSYQSLRGFVCKGLCAGVCSVPVFSHAALTIGSAMEITHRVIVQPIIVSNDDGSNTANYFGQASQQMEIERFVDQIWAQAGIDVAWLTPTLWNSTFTNIGTSGSNTRSQSDLFTTVRDGDAGGYGNADDRVLDIYFVEVVAGFKPQGANTANGLARVSNSGVMMYVGGNLPGSSGGREAVAHVAAHEIGHNLGLRHNTIDHNLLLPGSTNRGEELNSEQTATALSKPFTIPLGELPLVVGDLDDNGVADVFDLPELVLAYTRPETFAAQSVVDISTVGDLDQNGVFDLMDLRLAADTLPQYGRPQTNRAQNYSDMDLALDALDDGLVNGSAINLFETEIATGKLYEVGDSRSDFTGPGGHADGIINALDINYLFDLQSAAVSGDVVTVSAMLGDLATDADGDGAFTSQDALVVGGFAEAPLADITFDPAAWVQGLTLLDDYRLVPEPAVTVLLTAGFVLSRRRRA